MTQLDHALQIAIELDDAREEREERLATRPSSGQPVRGRAVIRAAKPKPKPPPARKKGK